MGVQVSIDLRCPSRAVRSTVPAAVEDLAVIEIEDSAASLVDRNWIRLAEHIVALQCYKWLASLWGKVGNELKAIGLHDP